MNTVRLIYKVVAVITVLIVLFLLYVLFIPPDLYGQTNEPPKWSPTPEQELVMGLTADQSNTIAYAEAMALASSPPIPNVADTNSVTTNLPPPRMTMDVYEGLPDYIKSEVVLNTRNSVDKERRPTVRFQKRITLTNDWEDVTVIEPWRMAEFYRIVIED